MRNDLMLRKKLWCGSYLISAKFGSTKRRLLNAKKLSNSWKAAVNGSSVKMAPTDGTSCFSLLLRGSFLCSETHRCILLNTSSHECVRCMLIMKSINASCSFNRLQDLQT